MFVTAKILVEENNARAVPKSALIEDGEEQYIFIKINEKHHDESEQEHEGDKYTEDENTKGEKKKEHKDKTGLLFKKVMVRTGVEDDKYIEIFPIENIKDDNEVVTSGAFYLRSELKKEEVGEHEH